MLSSDFPWFSSGVRDGFRAISRWVSGEFPNGFRTVSRWIPSNFEMDFERVSSELSRHFPVHLSEPGSFPLFGVNRPSRAFFEHDSS